MENLFGFKHLIGLSWVFIFVIISLFIMHKFNNKRNVLKIASIILIMLELTKYTYIYLSDGSISKIYIPLQFCSLFLYTFPIISFGKGKLAEFLKPVSYAGGIIAMLLALFLPTNILGDPNMSWVDPKNFIYTLSFVYHGWILAVSIYIRTSKFYVPQRGDLVRAVLAITIFAIIAMSANAILDTDFMLLKYGNGNPFQFILIENGFIPYFSIHVALMFILLSPLFIKKSTL